MNPERHDIAMVISDLGGGGAQRVVVTLANAWARRGRRVCVITLSDDSGDQYTLTSNVTRVALGQTGESATIAAATIANVERVFGLRKALRRTDSRVVISFIAVTNILTIVASVGLGSRVVISERNDPLRQSLGMPWDALRRVLYRFADVVTANSTSAVQSMRAFVPESKLRLVLNPVGVKYIDTLVPRDRRVILNVGRLSHQKAQDVLLRAFSLVTERVPDWLLVIVGEGPKEVELRKQSKDLGIADRIEWVGWTTDVARYYALADIFVLPSRFEGTPNALLEAMSFGVPSIVTNSSPGSLEYVQDDVTGLVVPVEDERALADAVCCLVENPDLRQRLGAASKNRVDSLQLDNVMDAWDNVVRLRSGGNGKELKM